MRTQLDGLERHGELAFGHDHYSSQVREELLSMSAATIDLYLGQVKAKDRLGGMLAPKPPPLLRNSIAVRNSTDEAAYEPGFFEGETFPHCGPTLKGEFAHTLNLTDLHTGWVFAHTIRNNAHVHTLAGLRAAVTEIPYEITGMDFDNDSGFLEEKATISWTGDHGLYFTEVRPYKENAQITIESKNNHLVRKYAFYYRYDTEVERQVLNRLWKLVNDRLNYLTPTQKPIGYTATRDGRRRRLYDKPQTPMERLLAAKVISPAQAVELITYRNNLNPAAIRRQIVDLQLRLLALAKDKTDHLCLDTMPEALLDVHSGIRVEAGRAHHKFCRHRGVRHGCNVVDTDISSVRTPAT